MEHSLSHRALPVCSESAWNRRRTGLGQDQWFLYAKRQLDCHYRDWMEIHGHHHRLARL
jgi:hypothetical protein